MRRFYAMIIFMLVLSSTMVSELAAQTTQPPKREFRAAWVTTVYNLDWPTDYQGNALVGKTSTIIKQQKTRIDNILKALLRNGFNAAFFQVRPMADAFYKSKLAPVSEYLTGERGSALTFDALEYAIQSAHSLGIELHAWLNPFRWSPSATTKWNTDIDNDIYSKGWILETEKGKIFNPGIPAARQYIVDVCKEIVENYDIDGLVFDDYFYTNPTPEDGTAGDYQLYKSSGTTMTLAQWRRNNINTFVREVYRMIQKTKPTVKFGISPAGVAKGGAKDAGLVPYSETKASDWQYAGIYSDPLAWLKTRSIDYISPQLYWNTDHATNPFGPLVKWWSHAAKHFNRHCYASQSISKLGTSNTQDDWKEVADEVQLSRDYTENNAPGCVFFREAFISGPAASGLGTYLKKNKFTTTALTPKITWRNNTTEFGSVKDINFNGIELTWSPIEAETTLKYSIYAIPSDVTYEDAFNADGDGLCSQYLVGVSYGNHFTIPYASRKNHGFAVCVLDRYGKEYIPATSGITGIENIANSEFSLKFVGHSVRFSTEAKEVCIYNLNGICVGRYEHVEEVSLSLPKGIYLIKAQSETGAVITSKYTLYK